MGVYIKGMKMPESCFQCPFRIKINPDDICCRAMMREFEETWGSIVCRHIDCPLVEVKEPHGDLIDRTALIKKARVIHIYDGDGFEFECMGVLDGTLVDAPAVIEAEGNDEDFPLVEARDECDSDSCPIHFKDEQPKYDPNEFFSAERSGKW